MDNMTKPILQSREYCAYTISGRTFSVIAFYEDDPSNPVGFNVATGDTLLYEKMLPSLPRLSEVADKLENMK